MKTCSQLIILLLLVTALPLCAQKTKIITRSTSNGGIFGFEEIKRVRWADAAGVVHVDITCLNSGSKFAPREVNPDNDMAGDYTPAEIDLMQQMMDVAIASISHAKLSGSHSQRIRLASGKTWLYEMSWKATDEHETNSLIEITRSEINY